MKRSRYAACPTPADGAQPFGDAEEAWFWFVQCRTARLQGARVAAGLSRAPRPCEPLDILAVVDRLYRHRRLLREHLSVLADYGQRLLRPDPRTPGEARAASLWDEAFAVIAPALRAKGVLE